MNHFYKAKVGDIIRAFDFKPMAGRDDAFVEGIVEEVNCTEPGYNCFSMNIHNSCFITDFTKEYSTFSTSTY
jgi:hypothetical protein